MRTLNGALLLELIRRHGPLSRAELARRSGLTKPTVSSQVAELLRRRIVVEDALAEPDSRGGKPARPVRFNALCGTIAGAEIGASQIRVALADLDGNVLDRIETPTRPERGARAALDALQRALGRLPNRHSKNTGPLVAIAIAAPGRVDVERGAVLEVGNVFHWRDVEVGKRIGRIFQVPVSVDNDVNVAAIGEMHHGVARGVANFALLRWSTGVGAGCVVDGRVYQGSHWAAGEIGHMMLDRSALDSLSERGHLESLIGTDQVAERACLSPDAASNGLAQKLAQAAAGNDRATRDLLENVATHIGMATANLAAVLDPELIVLDGEPFDLVTERIREVIARTLPWPVRIERSALGDEAVLLGALSVARGIAHDLLAGRRKSTTSESLERRNLA